VTASAEALRPAPRVLASGGRVLLRRPLSSDRAAFLAAIRRSRALHRGWVEPPDGAEAFAEYLRRARRSSCDGSLVLRLEDRELVAVVNVNEIVRGNLQSGYLGYYAFVPYQRQGYVREAVALCLRRSFEELGLHRLEANIRPENARSLGLVRALGFRLEGLSPRYLRIGGRWRDHERWAITLEDWRAGAGRLGPRERR
jgi:ribosomal-protein-alanine N-acetyltransferase